MPHHKKLHAVAAMPPSQPEVPRTRNPRYIPPRGDNRPIDKLPLEILAKIFEFGTFAEEHEEDWDVEEDDGDEEYEDIDDSNDEADHMSMRMPGSYKFGKPRVTNGADNVNAGDLEVEKTRNLPFQVRMSHVCRRWRQLALGTPVLWTTLDFIEPRPFAKSQEWLIRSKQCPLDLLIDASIPDDEEELDQWGEDPESPSPATRVMEDLTCILDLVIRHAARWRTFELTVSIYKHMHYALKRLEEECPKDQGIPPLQSLRLYCHEDHDDLEADMTPEEFRKHYSPFGNYTAKLLQLELWGVHLDWKMFIPPSERQLVSLNTAPSCTTELRELELAYHTRDVRPPYQDFVNIIRCSPKLTSLKLTNSGPGARPQGLTTETLYLSDLHHLSLGHHCEPYAIYLTRLICAPNLKSIALDFDDDDCTSLIDELVSEAPSSSRAPASLNSTGNGIVSGDKGKKLANVTDLKLGGLPCEDSCAATLYSACPNLKRLHLNMSFLPGSFFFSLIGEAAVPDDINTSHTPLGPARNPRMHQSKGPVLCKQLEALTISGLSGSSYMEFVKKRRALGVPISELSVDENDDVAPDESEWLSRNVKSLSFVEFSDDEEINILDEDVDSEDEELGWEFDSDDGHDSGNDEGVDEDQDEDEDFDIDDDDWED